MQHKGEVFLQRLELEHERTKVGMKHDETSIHMDRTWAEKASRKWTSGTSQLGLLAPIFKMEAGKKSSLLDS